MNTEESGYVKVMGAGQICGEEYTRIFLGRTAGEFTPEFEYFMNESKMAPHLDWFYPWYWNIRLTREIGNKHSNHMCWEFWAHNKLYDNRFFDFIYSKLTKDYNVSDFNPNFKNPSPSFDKPIENQANQIEEFTKLSSKDTVSNIKTYIENPEIAVEKAIIAVFTMWRASYSALRPEFNFDEE